MSNPSTRPDYRLDHVCLAVRKIAVARVILEKTLGYRARTEPVLNTRQQVVVQFMSKPGSMDIKLIEPGSAESPLVEFIKRSGGGLHHLAFRADSVSRAVDDLAALGGKVIAAPQPGEAFSNELIAFVYLGAGLNVEIIDTDKRQGELPF